MTRFDCPTWITLPVLELEHGGYHVGRPVEPDKSIKVHDDGEGSMWTRAHRPVAVHSPGAILARLVRLGRIESRRPN